MLLLLALTSFEATLRLVNNVDAALAAHDAAIAVTLLERAEGVANFHGSSPSRGAAIAPVFRLSPKASDSMVGGTGIEPVATTMST